MLTRREAIAAAASAALFPIAVRAQGLEFSSEIVLSNLEKSIWLSTNRNAPRAAYVIAAPWCPFCKLFYETQVAVQHDVDFRFVLTDFRGSGSAVVNAFFSDEVDQVGLFYQDPALKNGDLSGTSVDWFNNVNKVAVNMMVSGINSIIIGSGGSSSGAGFGYPTLVQIDQTGSIDAVLGAWQYLDTILKANDGVASAAPSVDRYNDLLVAAPTPKRTRKNHFAKEADTPYYAAPVADAPVVATIRKGSGYHVAGLMNFGGEEWIASTPFKNDKAMMWARKSEFFTQ